MDIFSEFAVNETLEIDGRWVPFNAKTKFKIARMNNAHYNRIFMRLYKMNKVILESKGKEAKAKSDDVMAEAFSKAILVGWEGPVKINGEDLGAYSQEKAKKALLIEQFRVWVAQQTEDFASYKAVQEDEEDETEDEAKN